MAEDRYTFAQARARLEDIVVQVRKKDTSLEKSLDLLEEGVKLANTCTELSDHTEWRSVAAEQDTDAPGVEDGSETDDGSTGEQAEEPQHAVEAAAEADDASEAISDEDAEGASQDPNDEPEA